MGKTASRTFPSLVSVPLLATLLASLGIVFAVASRGRRADRRGGDLDSLVERRTRELSALSTHLQDLAEKEKSELARNLHDELGGLLTAAKMDLSWLQTRLAAEPALAEPAVQQRLQQLGAVLDEAMDVKRRVVEDLRPSLLDHFGLATALRAYLETVSAKSGLACDIEIAEEEPVPKELAIALFRVVQEALTNIVRHAAAHHVRLRLASNERAYLLALSDDGAGIDLESPAFAWPRGLASIRHRVWALGGELTLRGTPPHGSILEVEVPRRRPAS